MSAESYFRPLLYYASDICMIGLWESEDKSATEVKWVVSKMEMFAGRTEKILGRDTATALFGTNFKWCIHTNNITSAALPTYALEWSV